MKYEKMLFEVLINYIPKISNSLDEISEEDLVSEAEDTLTILSKYINELDYSVDKKELDNLMRGLYNEALTLETIYD